MKLLKNLALAFLTIALFGGIRVIWRASSEEFTHWSVKSEEGVQIRQRIHGNQYGSPIEGSYLISLPTGKYIATSNIREWLTIQVIFLALGLFCMMGALREPPKGEHGNAPP